MTARYTVIQYVPDPTADERINVGVITWNDAEMHSHFVTDWRRVKAFGGEDIAFLRNFANSVTHSTSAQFPLPLISENEKFDSVYLEKIVGEWGYSIQFTDPRGSLKGPQALMKEVAEAFIRQAPPRRRRGRNRLTAASQAYQSVVDAVKHKAPDHVEEFVRWNVEITGKLDEHRFDVVLANGKPLAAAHGLSFEVIDRENLEREVDAIAWSIDDIKKEWRNFPIAVYVLPPLPNSSVAGTFRRAEHVFKGLKAEVVRSERRMGSWARKRAEKITA